MKVVLGTGRIPNRIMVVGEAPGRVEAETNRPFSGPSGKKLEQYFSYANLPSPRECYLTNIVKEYKEGNPDPTPEQILDWTPTLLSEIEESQSEIVIAVGSFASRLFLGENIPDMEIIHGRAHYQVKNPLLPLPGSIKAIFPVFHTAGALWNYERGSLIRYGYEVVGESLSRLGRGLPLHYRHDPFAGSEDYLDVSGRELSDELSSCRSIDIIGLDTEGEPNAEWSVQISLRPGHGRLLRVCRDDFYLGIQSIYEFLRRHRPIIAMHQASTPKFSCYDVIMCRGVSLELQEFSDRWFDTMYWAYLRRLESQSNKTLCERWQGMEMEDYPSLIGDIGRDKQIEYLKKAYSASSPLPKPPKRVEKKNTGLVKISQPKHIHASISSLLQDIENGKETKDGPTNPLDRWESLKESNPHQVEEVQREIGKMPVGTLDDIPLEKATFYGCRDSDGTLRNAITFMELGQ